LLDALGHIRDAVFDAIGDALDGVAYGFGAGCVVDGLADALVIRISALR
jgi:hypothetical protein